MKAVLFLIIFIWVLNPFSWAEEKKVDENAVMPALLIMDIQNQFFPMMQQEGQEYKGDVA